MAVTVLVGQRRRGGRDGVAPGAAARVVGVRLLEFRRCEGWRLGAAPRRVVLFHWFVQQRYSLS